MKKAQRSFANDWTIFHLKGGSAPLKKRGKEVNLKGEKGSKENGKTEVVGKSHKAKNSVPGKVGQTDRSHKQERN